jgi:XRE family aerobic/anaerobic benzoate catabolism transcriptional regulator
MDIAGFLSMAEGMRNILRTRDSNGIILLMQAPRSPLHRLIGQRVRRLRGRRDWTVRQLAERSGLSPRFVTDLEAGRANIAVGRLARVAEVLEAPLEQIVRRESPATGGARASIDTMLEGLTEEQVEEARQVLVLHLRAARPRAIALIGLRGAGKSSLGPRLAARLEMPFVELDERIQDAAGLGLAEIFALHGEPYYRRLEARALQELLVADEPCVVALSGGVVHNEEAWSWIARHTTSVWLKARPEEHMERVAAQGDHRPMADRADAMEELRGLLSMREPLYRRAQLAVDTSISDLEHSAVRLERELRAAGW